MPNSVFSVNTEIEIFVTKGGIYRPLWILYALSRLLHIIKHMNNNVDLIQKKKKKNDAREA